MWNALRIQQILRLLPILIHLSPYISAQQTHIKLEQGDLIGVRTYHFGNKLLYFNALKLHLCFQLKVFPDGTRGAVYAFLGIPYAQAPINELRFAVSNEGT